VFFPAHCWWQSLSCRSVFWRRRRQTRHLKAFNLFVMIFWTSVWRNNHKSTCFDAWCLQNINSNCNYWLTLSINRDISINGWWMVFGWLYTVESKLEKFVKIALWKYGFWWVHTKYDLFQV